MFACRRTVLLRKSLGNKPFCLARPNFLRSSRPPVPCRAFSSPTTLPAPNVSLAVVHRPDPGFFERFRLFCARAWECRPDFRALWHESLTTLEFLYQLLLQLLRWLSKRQNLARLLTQKGLVEVWTNFLAGLSQARAWLVAHPRFEFVQRYFPHLGYVISGSAILVTDILWLRTLMILANCCGLIVNRFIISPPFWTGIYWNSFFICANLVQILRVLLDRREVTLDDEQQALYDGVFYPAFSKPEFRKLIRTGQWTVLEPGTRILTEGERIDKVYLLSKGLCTVEEAMPVSQLPASVVPAASGPALPPAAGSLPVSSPVPSIFGARDKPKQQADLQTQPQPQPQVQVQAQVQVPVVTQTKPQTQPQPQSPSQPQTQSQPQPQAEATQAQTQAQVKILAQPAAPATAAASSELAKLESRSQPDREPERLFIGEITGGRLVGEMAVISTGRSDTSVAHFSVMAKEPTRALVWQKTELQKLFFRLPSLAVAWNSLVSTDLMTRLQDQRRQSEFHTYVLFLYGILADGKITKPERKAWEIYMQTQPVSPEMHERALLQHGWTLADWTRGTQQVPWTERLGQQLSTFSTNLSTTVRASVTPAPAAVGTSNLGDDAVAPAVPS